MRFFVLNSVREIFLKNNYGGEKLLQFRKLLDTVLSKTSMTWDESMKTWDESMKVVWPKIDVATQSQTYQRLKFHFEYNSYKYDTHEQPFNQKEFRVLEKNMNQIKIQAKFNSTNNDEADITFTIKPNDVPTRTALSLNLENGTFHYFRNLETNECYVNHNNKTTNCFGDSRGAWKQIFTFEFVPIF